MLHLAEVANMMHNHRLQAALLQFADSFVTS